MAPFCSCPASLVSRKFFAVGLGCAKCFCFVALRWAPRPFVGARAKKKHFSRGRSKKKKTTPWVVFFFWLWSRRKVAAPNGAQQKNKHFAHPGPTAKKILETNDAGHEQKGATTKKKNTLARTGVVFFFLLWPRPDAHSLTVGWGDFGKARVVFFFLLWPRRVFLDNNKKCLGYYIGSKKTRRGHSKKKKTPLPCCD